MRRRQFLAASAAGAGLALYPTLLLGGKSETQPSPTAVGTADHPARYYEKLPDGMVECRLCPRRCKVSDLERGYCGVRENKGGEYFTLVHSKVCSANVDPIEKKPFFHFLPGSTAFSIATAGCNLNCKFCQNWSISQFRPEDVNHLKLTPAECAATAGQFGSASIAYTYSEPTVFYEYMCNCAEAGRQAGLRSVVVTAGYIEKEPLVELAGLVDAIKIDLKAYSDSYYHDICNGELKPVLDTLVTLKSLGVWLEIVYLTLPGLNDSDSELKGLCDWLMSNLGSDVPIHFTRFHPAYLLENLPSTPIDTLERAHAIALEKGLHYVYIGNVYGHQAENTYCPNCRQLLIGRRGFQIAQTNLNDGACSKCHTAIPGVWS